MKKLVIFFLAAAMTACMQKPIDSSKIASLAAEQCAIMESGLTDATMPRTFKDGALVTSDLHWWCSGFFPGTAWYTYKLGGDTRELAVRQTAKLLDVGELNGEHDLGFQVMSSAGLAWKETGDSLYLKTIRAAAEKLAARFSPVTGTIKSWNWDDDSYPVIIDNMMNLELLTYASKLFNEPRWKEIAIQHARTTAENHFRPDYSCYHVVNYNPHDGTIIKKQTAQGYADESSWSRGQAWGLYGYTMMFRETGLMEFLDQAEHIAAFLMPKLKDRPVPNWDFDAPEQQDDASAAAIMASAFMELCMLTHDPIMSEEYRAQGEAILRELCSSKYLCKAGECGGFILKHSTGHFKAGSEVDVPLTYADYYFLEALWRRSQLPAALKKVYTVALPADEDNGLAGKERKRGADGFIYDVSEPQMTFFLPEKGNGKMVVICPGGGYAGVSMKYEGERAARWLCERGITACVLKYRMPNGHYNIPLADAQAALRYCRENFRMKQIGIMGFSAGGHLAASASTLFTDKATRPDFSILFYPVISMADEITHKGSKNNLLHEAVSDPSLVERFSLEKQVTADTPTTFITLCATDDVVPQENSIRYDEALKAHGVPSEMVVFPKGPHGFGFRTSTDPDSIKSYRQELYGALESWLEKL